VADNRSVGLQGAHSCIAVTGNRFVALLDADSWAVVIVRPFHCAGVQLCGADAHHCGYADDFCDFGTPTASVEHPLTLSPLLAFPLKPSSPLTTALLSELDEGMKMSLQLFIAP
jgi:hypothetical protein